MQLWQLVGSDCSIGQCCGTGSARIMEHTDRGLGYWRCGDYWGLGVKAVCVLSILIQDSLNPNLWTVPELSVAWGDRTPQVNV